MKNVTSGRSVSWFNLYSYNTSSYHPLSEHRTPITACVESALKNYEERRSNGNSSHNPQGSMPCDGSFVLVNPDMARSEYSRLRYCEGPGDILWMIEKDHTFLSGGGDPNSLKKATFGDSTGDLWIPAWEAIADFMNKRANGTNADNPSRFLPYDGSYSWLDPDELMYSRVGYDPGPKDIKWMEERDRNYVFRLEREGRLDQVEPNLRTERPALYAEVMAARATVSRTSIPVVCQPLSGSSSSGSPVSEQARLIQETQQRAAQERAQLEQTERAERERVARETQQQIQPSTIAASSSYVTTPTIASPNNVVIRWQDLTITQGPEGELGAGGFGIVHRGTWKGTPVAVKTLIARTMNNDTLNEFRRETEIMATLQHPNIVRLYGVCLEPGHNSMVMEYMQHGSLLDFLENHPNVSWSVRWNIALDISRGLLSLHQHHPIIMHRDLKSPNVLLDEHDRAKICDFGLAKVRHTTRLNSSRANPMSTRGFIGTINWTAPELFEPGAPYTPACDIYSLGIILWELATCKTPWASATTEALISIWVREGRHEPIPTTTTPPTFASLIANCWATRAENRPPIAAVVQELEQHQNEIQGTTAQTTTMSPPAPRST
ncbi:MAG: protein kinase [Gammaproteobacteria bacterium]